MDEKKLSIKQIYLPFAASVFGVMTSTVLNQAKGFEFSEADDGSVWITNKSRPKGLARLTPGGCLIEYNG